MEDKTSHIRYYSQVLSRHCYLLLRSPSFNVRGLNIYAYTYRESCVKQVRLMVLQPLIICRAWQITKVYRLNMQF